MSVAVEMRFGSDVMPADVPSILGDDSWIETAEAEIRCLAEAAADKARVEAEAIERLERVQVFAADLLKTYGDL